MGEIVPPRGLLKAPQFTSLEVLAALLRSYPSTAHFVPRSWNKVCWSQASEAPTLSFTTTIQMNKFVCLAELGPLVSNKLRIDTHHILCGSQCADLSLEKGMASTVVVYRHLWVTLMSLRGIGLALWKTLCLMISLRRPAPLHPSNARYTMCSFSSLTRLISGKLGYMDLINVGMTSSLQRR